MVHIPGMAHNQNIASPEECLEAEQIAGKWPRVRVASKTQRKPECVSLFAGIDVSRIAYPTGVRNQQQQDHL